MKQHEKEAIIGLLCLNVFIYLSFSFILLELNPLKWHVFIRFCSVIIFAIFFIKTVKFISEE